MYILNNLTFNYQQHTTSPSRLGNKHQSHVTKRQYIPTPQSNRVIFLLQSKTVSHFTVCGDIGQGHSEMEHVESCRQCRSILFLAKWFSNVRQKTADTLIKSTSITLTYKYFIIDHIYPYILTNHNAI